MLIGRGKTTVLVINFHVQEVKWYMMSVPQREQHLKNFSNASVTDITPSSDLGQSTSLTSECLGRDLLFATSLAVDVHGVANFVRIPLNSPEGIWKKAAELLKT